MTLPDLIGLTGVVIVLIAYFLLQTEKIQLAGYKYSAINLVGSSLILVSLFYNFNLASAAIEASWVAISFYGITKAFKQSQEE